MNPVEKVVLTVALVDALDYFGAALRCGVGFYALGVEQTVKHAVICLVVHTFKILLSNRRTYSSLEKVLARQIVEEGAFSNTRFASDNYVKLFSLHSLFLELNSSISLLRFS